jgi:anti-sigma B factor antagonist
MSELARLEFRRSGGTCVVEVHGEVDMSNAGEVLAGIRAAVPNGVATLIVDLTETRFLDSTGLRVLFRLAERLQARRQVLRLVIPEGSPVRAVVELTGLDEVIPVDAELAAGFEPAT